MNSRPAESDLDQLSIDAIRVVARKVAQDAHARYPGPALEAVPMLYVLWSRFLKHNPSNPGWFDRDRFVLSAARGSVLLYSLHYLTGYDLSLQRIEQFRRWGGEAESYPEGCFVLEDGIATSLGEGVGMAMVEAQLAGRYNRSGFEIVDHYTYVIVGDPDLVGEGAAQAASLAGRLALGKLICLYNSRHAGPSPLAGRTFAEDRRDFFEACGWHTQVLVDGNDVEAIERAIRAAQAVGDRPSLILVRTRGASAAASQQDVFAAHSLPWCEAAPRSAKEKPGWCIPDEVVRNLRGAVEKGEQAEQAWRERFAAYAQAYPDLARELEQAICGELPAQWDVDIPYFRAGLQPPRGTVPVKIPSRSREVGGLWRFRGHSLHFGPGEHAMRAVLSGMAAHGGAIPFGATFLIFAVYMHPVIRPAAWMHLVASAA